jgi:hypothetical protein
MLYSGDDEVGAEPDAVLDVELTDWAMARGTRRNRRKRFMVGNDVIELNMLEVEGRRRRRLDYLLKVRKGQWRESGFEMRAHIISSSSSDEMKETTYCMLHAVSRCKETGMVREPIV